MTSVWLVYTGDDYGLEGQVCGVFDSEAAAIAYRDGREGCAWWKIAEWDVYSSTAPPSRHRMGRAGQLSDT